MSNFQQKAAELQSSGIFFCSKNPVYVSRAPGRLDLMGGNVDYTGGLVFQATIREATSASVQRRDDQRISFWNPQMKSEGWADRVDFEFASLTDEAAVKKIVNRSPKVRWTAYV